MTDANGNVIPDQQQMAPGIQIVQPPAEVDRRETVGPSTSQKVVTASPATQAAMDQEAAAGQQKLAAQDQEFQAKVPQLEAEAHGEELRAQQLQQFQAQRAQAAAEHQKAIDARVAEAAQRRKDMEAAAKPTTFWQDRSAPARVVSGFLTSLGDFANARSGGVVPNYAGKVLEEEQAKDRAAKLHKFETSKEFLELAKQDVGAAQDAKARMLKQIDDEEVVQSKVLDKQIGALSKRLGIPAAQAAHAAFQAKTEQDDAAKRVTERQHYDGEDTKQSGHTDVSHTVNTPKGEDGAPNPLLVRDMTGTPRGLAPDVVRARAQQALTQDAMKLQRATDEMKAHISANGGYLNPVTQQPQIREREEMKGRITGLQSSINMNSGVVNGGERPIFNKPQDPGLWETIYNGGNKDSSKALDNMSSAAINAVNDGMKSMGIDHGGRPAAAPSSGAPASRPAARPARAEIASDADKLRAALKADPTGPRADAIRATLKTMAGEYGRN